MLNLRHRVGSSISALWLLSQGSIVERSQILMYHSVGGHADGDLKGIYSVSVENFRRQMTSLFDLCDRGITKVVPFGQEQPGALSITFDDGYEDNFTVATSILEDFHFPFHIFINPLLVMECASRMLSLSQIKDLAQHPLASVGIHGYSHTPLTELSLEQVKTEIISATAWLEDIIQQPVTTLSYPHGAVNLAITHVAHQCGIQRAASSKFGPTSNCSDPLNLPRIDIWSSDSIKSFESKISGGWDWMKWRT